MAKRGYSTFGAKNKYDTRYNLPKTPENGDTIFIDDSEPTESVINYFVEPDNLSKEGEWLTGHFMHMFEGSNITSGVVDHSIVAMDSLKDLTVKECPASSGEECIGVYQALNVNGIPDEDDVCAIAISGIWPAIYASGSPNIGEYARVSSAAAGEGDDISSAGTARIGVWADGDPTYASLWICGMERA